MSVSGLHEINPGVVDEIDRFIVNVAYSTTDGWLATGGSGVSDGAGEIIYGDGVS